MGGVCAWNLTSSLCGGVSARCVEREVAMDYPKLCRGLEPVRAFADLLNRNDSSRASGVVAEVERRTPYSTPKANARSGLEPEGHELAQKPLQQITQIESVSTLFLNTPVPKLLSTYIEQYALLRTRERKMLDTTLSTGLASSAPGCPSRCRPPRRARAC
ncbi:hypothetical protein K466DRAFT_112986 [Polyporus arcularius HHB13444]|uniref:Uncharacterized protein n=1 Tax=Polyporus arcularius HHB13444 TaxID=1314778 RepID=A0A5C3PGR9_9APHY|nr:hypothetical protein K466DRAFT_112986 [Polyporus arcularius HHB13444]